ncbi:hypothetical protein WBG78_26195 [Chryseolinea sp. T2]|uniref:hypothetical protein n=1 Tax=Chryseolinea sp. T2 TaxID=3129255 RepID=UPI003077343E
MNTEKMSFEKIEDVLSGAMRTIMAGGVAAVARRPARIRGMLYLEVLMLAVVTVMQGLMSVGPSIHLLRMLFAGTGKAFKKCPALCWALY